MKNPDTNPKSLLGNAKPGLSSVPPIALIHLGRAMDNGVAKYGLMNWRGTKVSATVYYNAIMRHALEYWDGETIAKDSGVHHLGHIMACCAILLDAEANDVLIDNRPAIFGRVSAAIASFTKRPDSRNAAAFAAMSAPYGSPEPAPAKRGLSERQPATLVENGTQAVARQKGYLEKLKGDEEDLAGYHVPPGLPDDERKAQLARIPDRPVEESSRLALARFPAKLTRKRFTRAVDAFCAEPSFTEARTERRVAVAAACEYFGCSGFEEVLESSPGTRTAVLGRLYSQFFPALGV